MNRADASAINYQNGKKVNLSEATNLYQPHNQNDGVQQYNDRALLGMDYANQKTDKKVKQLKTWGWVSGIAGVGLGALFVNIGLNADYDEDMVKYCIVGGVLAAGGYEEEHIPNGFCSHNNNDHLLLQYSTLWCWRLFHEYGRGCPRHELQQLRLGARWRPYHVHHRHIHTGGQAETLQTVACRGPAAG